MLIIFGLVYQELIQLSDQPLHYYNAVTSIISVYNVIIHPQPSHMLQSCRKLSNSTTGYDTKD